MESAQILKQIGLRIAELRLKKGLSREGFAGIMGMSPRYLGRLESGGQNLSVKALVRLAESLDVELVDLFAEPGIKAIPVGRPKTPTPNETTRRES